MKLICRTCKIEISKELTELENLNLLNTNDGQDYISEGFFIIDNRKADIELEGAIIINIKDCISQLKIEPQSTLILSHL